MIHKGGEWVIGFVLFTGIAIAVLIYGLTIGQGVLWEFWGFLIVANLFTFWGDYRFRRNRRN